VINSDSMSSIDRAEQAVARTPDEWQALWRRHAPGRPAPTLDFNRDMVVAVFLGSRPSGGYAAEITSTAIENGVLVVRWRESAPAPGQMAAQVVTAPSHIATVPRHAGQVRFEKVTR
jgi:hypothetical protein